MTAAPARKKLPIGIQSFGKSLLIDTLAELFEGNQTLFEGLYCFDRWDWSVRYPVIRISFGGGLLADATNRVAACAVFTRAKGQIL